MSYESIHHMIKGQAEHHPEAIAIMAPERQALTYHGLLCHIQQTVTWLNAHGIGRHDRVALVLPDGPEMAVAFLGVAAGASSAPLNPGYRRPEFCAYLSALKARTVIVPAGVDTPVRAAAASLGLDVIELEPCLDGPAGLFTLSGTARTLSAPGDMAERDDVALLLHTSGTTSRPKMVPLSQQNLCVSADNIRRTLQLTPTDRGLSVMPLFHIHGLVAGTLASLAAGASIVYPPGFDVQGFVECVSAYHPTWYTAVPTMHQAIVEYVRAHPQTRKPSSLRFIRSSSSALPPPVMADLERLFEVPVIEAYGMTEAAHQMCSNALPPEQRKAGSVGRPAGPEVMIIAADGQPLPAGHEGEVVIRGANVMAAYEDNPEANQEAFINGWFRTGDYGRVDDEGYVYLTGRIKEIINRGGENVSPHEVEAALLEHPDVVQAVAFAAPHVRLGEDVAAAVVRRPQAAVSVHELRSFVAARLADHKVPSQIALVEAIPKGPTGKLQRIGLYEQLEPLLHADFTPARTVVEEALTDLWCDVLGIDRPGIDDNFFALSGDSLAVARLAVAIEKTFNRSLPLASLLQAPTIRQLAVFIRDAQAVPTAGGLLALQEHGNKPPLFCLPALGGATYNFVRLSEHLGHDQPVYTFQYPGLDGQRQPLDRIEDLAAEFLPHMYRVQPQGPYHLCGFCFGGIVCYEIAQQLTDQGHEVGLLLMLDTFTPQTHPWYTRHLEGHFFGRDLEADSVVMSWMQQVVQQHRLATLHYHLRPYPGQIALITVSKRGQLVPGWVEEPLHGWGELAQGGVQHDAFHSYHHKMFHSSKIGRLAKRIRRLLPRDASVA
jgi:acyl-CoA synthetase (AMP-forming)/AMP-acid ligase II/thioesterase domain-containing protein/acyl carrier protein